jgi:hypothetical protein
MLITTRAVNAVNVYVLRDPQQQTLTLTGLTGTFAPQAPAQENLPPAMKVAQSGPLHPLTVQNS